LILPKSICFNVRMKLSMVCQELLYQTDDLTRLGVSSGLEFGVD
jgi:hypothetical protein